MIADCRCNQCIFYESRHFFMLISNVEYLEINYNDFILSSSVANSLSSSEVCVKFTTIETLRFCVWTNVTSTSSQFEQSFKGLGSWFRSLGAFYEGSQVILRSNKNKNLQASSFVISMCIRIFRTRRKRAFSLRGIIHVNYARRRLVYEANL